MSNDLFQENTPAFEQSRDRDEEEIIASLVEEFQTMFRRENLEQNPYLVFKMNSSLEIPITAIYKDKRIGAISTNLALIREALARTDNVNYDREKEILRPKIRPMKNKIILNKIQDNQKNELTKMIYSSPEYAEKASDKYLENLKSYNIVLKKEEAAASLIQKIKEQLGEKSQTEIVWEYEDLYVNLAQKAQDSLRNQQVQAPESQFNLPNDVYAQNFNYYYGMNPYGNPYMGGAYGGFRGGYGNYYNGYYNQYNQMFIRKAQDEPNEPEYNEYEHRGGRYGKRDKYQKKGGYGRYRGEREKKTISVEEIEKKTTVDSENFPPLVSHTDFQPATNNIIESLSPEKKDKEKKKVRFNRHDLVDLFKKVEGLKPNENLKKLDPNQIPVLELEAKPDLEFINPTVIKRDIRTTPKTIPLTPKQQAK